MHPAIALFLLWGRRGGETSSSMWTEEDIRGISSPEIFFCRVSFNLKTSREKRGHGKRVVRAGRRYPEIAMKEEKGVSLPLLAAQAPKGEKGGVVQSVWTARIAFPFPWIKGGKWYSDPADFNPS